MTKITELHERWLSDPEYRNEYEALEEEFSLAVNFIEAKGNGNPALNPAPALSPTIEAWFPDRLRRPE
jgi:hypothetical protein